MLDFESKIRICIEDPPPRREQWQNALSFDACSERETRLVMQLSSTTKYHMLFRRHLSCIENAASKTDQCTCEPRLQVLNTFTTNKASSNKKTHQVVWQEV